MGEHKVKRPAVFIDRDGVIIRQVDELTDPSQLELLPWAAEAIADLKAREFFVIVITNQPIIEKGLLTMEKLAHIHEVLQEMIIAVSGARLDAFYTCPHRYQEKEQCECRKPGQKLIADARKDFNIDMTRSWFIGDRLRDIETGRRAGIETVLVMTGGESKDDEFFPGVRPDRTAASLYDAASIIIEQHG